MHFIRAKYHFLRGRQNIKAIFKYSFKKARIGIAAEFRYPLNK